MEFSKQEILSMDVVEYAEKVLKIKLTKWQQSNVQRLQTNPLPPSDIFEEKGDLYGVRACYLLYERWKNRISRYEE